MLEDIIKLTESYKGANLMTSSTAGETMRTHSPCLMHLTQNPMSDLNGKALADWLDERLGKAQVRQTYRQFLPSTEQNLSSHPH